MPGKKVKAKNTNCPLCLDKFDVDDKKFFPCTCGYQICRFCWHRIRTAENKLCPACRKEYTEDPANFTPLTPAELKAFKMKQRRQAQQKKQKAELGRKSLEGMRVIQTNLVFVVGLPKRLANAEILKKREFFGKYGKIEKIIVNQNNGYAGIGGPSPSAFVTFSREDDALRAIRGVNNSIIEGRTIRTSLGTSKYCVSYVNSKPCYNAECMYLHELGDPEATFSAKDIEENKHRIFEQRLHDAQIARDTLTNEKSGCDCTNCPSTVNINEEQPTTATTFEKKEEYNNQIQDKNNKNKHNEPDQGKMHNTSGQSLLSENWDMDCPYTGDSNDSSKNIDDSYTSLTSSDATNISHISTKVFTAQSAENIENWPVLPKLPVDKQKLLEAAKQVKIKPKESEKDNKLYTKAAKTNSTVKIEEKSNCKKLDHKKQGQNQKNIKPSEQQKTQQSTQSSKNYTNAELETNKTSSENVTGMQLQLMPNNQIQQQPSNSSSVNEDPAAFKKPVTLKETNTFIEAVTFNKPGIFNESANFNKPANFNESSTFNNAATFKEPATNLMDPFKSNNDSAATVKHNDNNDLCYENFLTGKTFPGLSTSAWTSNQGLFNGATASFPEFNLSTSSNFGKQPYSVPQQQLEQQEMRQQASFPEFHLSTSSNFGKQPYTVPQQQLEQQEMRQQGNAMSMYSMLDLSDLVTNIDLDDKAVGGHRKTGTNFKQQDDSPFHNLGIPRPILGFQLNNNNDMLTMPLTEANLGPIQSRSEMSEQVQLSSDFSPKGPDSSRFFDYYVKKQKQEQLLKQQILQQEQQQLLQQQMLQQQQHNSRKYKNKKDIKLNASKISPSVNQLHKLPQKIVAETACLDLKIDELHNGVENSGQQPSDALKLKRLRSQRLPEQALSKQQLDSLLERQKILQDFERSQSQAESVTKNQLRPPPPGFEDSVLPNKIVSPQPPQMPSESSQLLPDSTQLPTQSPQLLTQAPQLLYQSPQLVPHSHQLVPNSHQMAPNWHQTLPNTHQLVPQSPQLSQIRPQNAHITSQLPQSVQKTDQSRNATSRGCYNNKYMDMVSNKNMDYLDAPNWRNIDPAIITANQKAQATMFNNQPPIMTDEQRGKEQQEILDEILKSPPPAIPAPRLPAAPMIRPSYVPNGFVAYPTPFAIYPAPLMSTAAGYGGQIHPPDAGHPMPYAIQSVTSIPPLYPSTRSLQPNELLGFKNDNMSNSQTPK